MNIAIVGAQWGDEGKGKIVDFLAESTHLVVRFSGGANAGHTIVSEEKTYKLHLIPSGIIYSDKTVLLGTGMVIDPEALFEEIRTLEEVGIDCTGRIKISDRAHIVLPGYKKRDIEMDRQRREPLGTTGRGIGITYALKAFREGIRFADIFEPEIFDSLEEEDRKFLEKYRDRLKPMLVNIVSFMASRSEGDALLEGAQGILLDIDYGTYPYVSSGSSIAAGAASGGGLGPREIHKVMGVFKAYTTRVGNGPFPSEFNDTDEAELCHYVREEGREYGVTTGRPRRCGHLDLVALKYACQAGSVDALVLTHIDVYDKLDTVSVCTGYEIDGEITDEFPASTMSLNRARPVLKQFPGWKESVAECTTYDQLPENAKSYLSFIEDFTGTPVEIISVGYQRKATIVRHDPWIQS